MKRDIKTNIDTKKLLSLNVSCHTNQRITRVTYNEHNS